MTYKFMKRLQKDIKNRFNQTQYHTPFINCVLSGVNDIDHAPDDQLIFAIFDAKNISYHLVIVKANDQNYCPVYKKLDDKNAFFKACYGEYWAKAPTDIPAEAHRQAVKNALDILGFHQKKYVIKYVKRNATTGKFIDEKIEYALKPMTEQQTLRFISKCNPKTINNIALSYEVYDLTNDPITQPATI